MEETSAVNADYVFPAKEIVRTTTNALVLFVVGREIVLAAPLTQMITAVKKVTVVSDMCAFNYDSLMCKNTKTSFWC